MQDIALHGRHVPPGTFVAPSTLLLLKKCFLLVPLEEKSGTMGTWGEFQEAKGPLSKEKLGKFGEAR